MANFLFGSKKDKSKKEYQEHEHNPFFRSDYDHEVKESTHPSDYPRSFNSQHERGQGPSLRAFRRSDMQNLRSTYENNEEEPPIGFRRSLPVENDFPNLQAYQKQSQRDDLRGLEFWSPSKDEVEFEDDEENSLHEERPSPIKFLMAISGLAVVCSVTWFAYKWISKPTSNTPPLIQADQGPYKIRPEQPGGETFPHQDKLIYERLSPSNEQPVERLLPPPEQPVMQRPQVQQQPYTQPYQQGNFQQPNYPQNGQDYQQQPQQIQPQNGQPQYAQQQPYNQQGYYGQNQAQVVQMETPYYQNQPQTQPQAQGNQNYQHPPIAQNNGMVPAQVQQPQSYQGVPGQPQQNNYPNSQSSLKDASAENTELENTEFGEDEDNPVDVIPQAQNNNLTQQTIPAHQNPATVMHNTVKPKVVAAHNAESTASTEAADNRVYTLQLGTLSSQELAVKEKERIKTKYARELKGLDIQIKSLNVNGKKQYVLRAGPVKSAKLASEKCSKIGATCKPIKE